MDFKHVRSVDEHGHVVLTIGRNHSEFKVSLERGTGGISVSRVNFDGSDGGGLYLYADEDQAVVDAIASLIAERPKNRAAQRKAWLAENGDKLVHFQCSVDLSINQAKAALESIEARVCGDGYTVEVLYGGRWLTLCRTDLHDDVCTTGRYERVHDAQGTVRSYRNRIQYGARIDNRRFAVVDSTTDG